MSDSVYLMEIDADSVITICRLKVAPGQETFVAPNAFSIAQAHFEPKAWFRGVYVGEESGATPVGFVMLSIDPDAPKFYLWRLMIADGFQRRGYGKRVIALVTDEIRRRGAREIVTSYVPGDLGPEGFYKSLGFVETGEIDDGEIVCRLDLAGARS